MRNMWKFLKYYRLTLISLRNYSNCSVNKLVEEISADVKIEIEKRWKTGVMNSVNKRKGGEPYYVLSMFPYPSGNLHMGHVRVYSISDSLAHFYRMCGYNVIHPMGWDAFGLPAENAAFQRNIAPADWTKTNIENMKRQLSDLGCCFNWEREVNTSDPKYYKWTQVIFLQLFKVGLAYKQEACVNWDPVDETVLADEQVDANGFSWRSGAKVEKRVLNQWFIKTTKYAKDLFDGLETKYLDDWKDIIQIQKHWIGVCSGTVIDLMVVNEEQKEAEYQKLTVWTDKPETITCAKFIAISSSHILNRKQLYKYDCSSYKELLVRAVNPMNGDALSIYVTDNISYPEGADSHLGCPSSSDADQHFLSQINVPFEIDFEFRNKSDTDRVELAKIVCDFLKRHNIGGYLVSSKLKDWLISRQRYWGTPIPIVHCHDCGCVAVPDQDLPVVFPKVHIQGKFNTRQALDKVGWLQTPCPQCGKEATRDTDTMDTFVDSSWYFLRYLDPNNDEEPFNTNVVSKSFPVNVYIGGKEHAVLHLYYARFITHFLYSIGKLKDREPFVSLLVQGMVMGKAFKIKDSGKYIPESEVKIIDERKGLAVTRQDNQKVQILWEKMSKSKHNGVDPSNLIKEYGCDTTRLFILGDVSPRSSRNWSSSTFQGILNWQKRIWCTVGEFINNRNMIKDNYKDSNQFITEFKQLENSLKNARNQNICNVTHGYAYSRNLSSVISRLQSLSKVLRQKYPSQFTIISAEYEKCLGHLIIMLAPMAPHFASELWNGFTSAPHRIDKSHNHFQWDDNVVQQKWPVVDADYNLSLICKINGNEMGHIHLLAPELNQLTESSAMKYILNDVNISCKLKRQFVHRTSLDVYVNCYAVFNFIMDYKNTSRQLIV